MPFLSIASNLPAMHLEPKLLMFTPIHCLHNAIHCLHNAIHCLHNAIHCLHNAIHCLHNAIHCQHNAIHCLHNAIHCIHNAIHCLHNAIHCIHNASKVLANGYYNLFLSLIVVQSSRQKSMQCVHSTPSVMSSFTPTQILQLTSTPLLHQRWWSK